jgi:hypothetical protein
MWLGTFNTSEEAARAYDAVAWRCSSPHRELNFAKVESIEEAEFLALSFRIMSRTEELHMLREYLQLRTHHAGEAAMAVFRTAQPEYMQAELDFYAKKDEKKKLADTGNTEKKKKQATTSTSRGEAGPSIINVESEESKGDG